MKLRIYTFGWLLIVVGVVIAGLIGYDNIGEKFDLMHWVMDGVFAIAALWAAGFGVFVIRETKRQSELSKYIA